MNSFRYAIILSSLVGVLWGQGAQLFGRITFPLGTVEVQKSQVPGWTAAQMRQEVFAGDKVRTQAKSRCEITLNGGGKFRIGEKSEVELTAATITPLKKDFNAKVNAGQVWVAAKAAFGETRSVTVRTPTAVAAIRGTKYRAVADDEESSILVYDGKVDVNWAESVDEDRQGQAPGQPQQFKIGAPTEVAAPEEVPGPYEVTLEDWITLVEGMQINVRRDGKYSMFEFDQAADADLDFVRWNKERDAEAGE